MLVATLDEIMEKTGRKLIFIGKGSLDTPQPRAYIRPGRPKTLLLFHACGGVVDDEVYGEIMREFSIEEKSD